MRLSESMLRRIVREEIEILENSEVSQTKPTRKPIWIRFNRGPQSDKIFRILIPSTAGPEQIQKITRTPGIIIPDGFGETDEFYTNQIKKQLKEYERFMALVNEKGLYPEQTEIYEIPFENPALPRSRRQDKEIDALANQTMDNSGQISVRGKTGNPRWRK